MRKYLIRAGYKIQGRREVELFDKYKKEYFKPLDEIEFEQLEAFKNLFSYSKKAIPFYEELFSDLKLTKDDFKSLEDLEKIPILTKAVINENYNRFSPSKPYSKYVLGSTGGSTGKPLKYRMSQECYARGFALLYRGWGQASYKLGDKMALLAGTSLIKDKNTVRSIIAKKLLNVTPFSSYGISQEDLKVYYEKINTWQPSFLRGYPSSMAFFAAYLSENNFKLKKPLKAVFSTAEVLGANQRSIIESTFGVKVYNQYGLNDGGVSAYEDHIVEGMGIDTERSILEIANNDGIRLKRASGRILATSLYNYDFPFIRYDTGDTGVMDDWTYQNTLVRPRLLKLEGRVTDYIVVNGKTIGSPVLTILMGKIDASQYQIIQEEENKIRIIIKVLPSFKMEQEKFIRKSLFTNVGEFDLIFDYSGVFISSKNKHKFIVNKLN